LRSAERVQSIGKSERGVAVGDGDELSDFYVLWAKHVGFARRSSKEISDMGAKYADVVSEKEAVEKIGAKGEIVVHLWICMKDIPNIQHHVSRPQQKNVSKLFVYLLKH
jgi:hypothetical protein